MRLSKLILLLFLSFALSVGSFATRVHASANITLSPSSGTFSGSTFSVDVYVSGNTQAINAVSATVSFPTASVSATSVSKTGAILGLWAEEPSISNTAGTVRMEGVILNPGFSGTSGKIATIRFARKGQSSGPITIRVASGSVLANGGQGTNVTGVLGSAVYTLAAAATPAPVPVVEAPTTRDLPTPVITSATHPLEDVWYTNTVPVFTWGLPSDMSAVRLGYSASENTIPGKVYTPAIKEKGLEALSDGQYWFAAQFKSGTVWGPVARYKVQIDTSARAPFTLTQTGTSIGFSTTDETSGIEYYEVKVGDLPAVRVAGDANAPYDIAFAGGGEHTVIVKAVDRAGNSTSAPEIVVTVPSAIDDIVLTPSLFDTLSTTLGRQVALYGGLALLVALIVSIVWFAFIRFVVLRKKMRHDLASLEQTLQDDFSTLREHLDLSSNHVSARSKVKPIMDKMLKNSKETIDLVERDITHKIENLRKRL